MNVNVIKNEKSLMTLYLFKKKIVECMWHLTIYWYNAHKMKPNISALDLIKDIEIMVVAVHNVFSFHQQCLIGSEVLL